MKRVTDFSEVEYIVPDGTDLPKEIKDYLALYSSKRVVNSSTGERGTKYTIPRYMMKEWLEKYVS